MARIVQKYGGSSVADLQLITSVARRAIAAKNAGHEVVVVLSAMKGETDRLLKMAREACPTPDPRETDNLLSTGEQVSTALFALVCHGLGETVKSFLGFQAGVMTDKAHGRARILNVNPARLRTELSKGRLAAVAGFQGINANDDITTLGRGGSDTTAVALAAALKADVCEIYTDVDGIYTTDPHVCDKARKIDRISYEEMLEMASLGAKVMEIRSVELGMNHGVKIHVRHARSQAPGTIICEEDDDMEKAPVRGVTVSVNEARITLLKVPDRPGVAASILSLISSAGIVVDMIIQNKSVSPADQSDPDQSWTDFSFTVPLADYRQALELMTAAGREIGAQEVVGDDHIAKVSIVGAGMRNHTGVAALMFQTLADKKINIAMISTSEIKISCIIEKDYAELSVRALHEAFQLDQVDGGRQTKV
ncbi:MAG: aspartate kinase [Deltaproteobacteria bacterium]|jgi:aspartate kinase|nr:aspartate kinase [Deltaproteobacteria bacterium]